MQAKLYTLDIIVLFLFPSALCGNICEDWRDCSYCYGGSASCKYWSGDQLCVYREEFGNYMNYVCDDGPCVSGKMRINSPGANVNCGYCQAGKYNDNWNYNYDCVSCPIGKYSTALGARSVSTCETCLVGTYSSTAGVSQCTPAPPGSYSVSGTSIPCPPGFFSTAEGATVCTGCAPGMYSNVTGASSSAVCLPCTQGAYTLATGSSSCCKPDMYTTSYTSACESCPSNKNRSLPMLWAPMAIRINGPFPGYKCEYHTMANNQPAYKCPNNYFVWWWLQWWMGIRNGESYVGSNMCTQSLHLGITYVNGEPNPVTALLAVSTEVEWCSCQSGKYSSASGSSTCTPCATSCPIGQQIQTPCTPTSNITCGACTPVANCFHVPGTACGNATNPNCLCPPGFELVGNQCQPCKAGFFRSANFSRPCAAWNTAATCAAGHFLSNGTRFADTVCIPCPAPPSNGTPRSAGCQWGCSAGYNSTF